MTTETVAQDAKAEATRPYVAWRTLFNLLERMSSEPPPPRIDRTYLRNLDGNAQTQLMAALRWLGLIETDGTVTSDLRSLLGNAGVRKVALAQIIRNKYPEAIALAEQNATQGQLDDAFRTYGLGGDTLRKAESFFLRSGAVDADLGFFSRLATPSFWVFPEKSGTRSAFYAEAFPGGTGYARSAKGSGMARLVLNHGSQGLLEVLLTENQGLTLQRTGERDIRFSTDPHNEWRNGAVRMIYPLATGLTIDLYIPKATSGAIAPASGVAGKTEVKNNVTSWKSGRIWIATSKGGSQINADGIGPGVTATIDEASGSIETGFVKVEFASLKSAISLTSEFASLAMSPLSKVK